MGKLCRKHVFISGHVQNVGFRWYMRERANELGLGGWVRNLPDGRVEAVFQGECGLVEAMEEWCRKGSPASRVKCVIISEEMAVSEESGFDIR